MSLRLTRGEYWLLTQAVRFELPFSLIALPEGPPWDVDTIDMALNCQGHGMGFDELAQTLHELAERGWIALRRCYEEAEALPGDLATIRAELSKPRTHFGGTYYGLTAAGGHAWEQFARPQWHWFVEHEYDDVYEIDASGMLGHPEDPEQWRLMYVTTADPSILDEYMSAVRADYEIAAGSEQFDALDDWQPVYWKSSTDAVRCRFRCREMPRGDDQHRPRSIEAFPAWCYWL